MPARTILALGTTVAVSFVLYAIAGRFPVPAWDDWDWLTWLLSSPPSFSRLFIPHNEHVIPIARLLEWLQYRLQGANGSLIFWISLVAKLATGGVIWLEIAHRWPAEKAWRQTALGAMLLTFFCAWQLHAIVLTSSVLFPLSMFFAVLAMSLAVRDLAVASLVASLGAMLTTTNGIAVPAIVGVLAVLQRSFRLAAAHAVLFALGVATYAIVALGPHAPPTPGVIAFFCAVFASFVTYASPIAGVVVGALLVAAGIAVSWRNLRTEPQVPRLERFAVGVMAFSLASALMVAAGRAREFGLDYAAQSRYSTFATAYWSVLVLALMSTYDVSSGRPSGRWTGGGPRPRRLLAIAAGLVLFGVHVISGVIWFGKADSVRVAGLALAANVRDDEWIRTLHETVDVVYRGRELVVADGDRTIIDPALGQTVAFPASTPTCAGALTVTPAPPAQSNALRLSGTAKVASGTGWILDARGVVVGVAGRAPLAATPDPSGAQIFRAVHDRIVRGTLFSRDLWFGFAPASSQSPLMFVAVDHGQVVCRSPL